MYMRPGEKERYGYKLRNYFTGEVLASRCFESREEMEAGLAEDLAPDKLIGAVFKEFSGDKAEA